MMQIGHQPVFADRLNGIEILDLWQKYMILQDRLSLLAVVFRFHYTWFEKS